VARVFASMSLALALFASTARAMIALEPIREVIRGSYDALYQCVASEPPGTYLVTVRFRVEADGSVSRAVPTRSDLGSDDPALDCVLRTVLALRFAPSSRGGHIEVTYPFRFVR
jgi:hypothetical protein